MKTPIAIVTCAAFVALFLAVLPERPGQAQIGFPPGGAGDKGGPSKPEIRLEEAQELLKDVPAVNVRFVGKMVVLDGSYSGEDNRVRIEKIRETYGNVLDLTNYSEPVEIYLPIAEQIRDKIPFPEVVVTPVKGGRLILSGTVSSQGNKDEAERIAKAYHPPEKVINTIQVRQQVVEVDVIFASVDLTRLRESGTGMLRDLGLTGVGSLSYSRKGKKSTSTTSGGSTTEDEVASGANPTWQVSANLSGALRLLRDNGYIRTLAQPHLSTISGGVARFHRGGTRGFEVAGTGSANVEYKDYGVILQIAPEVLSHGHIRAAVSIEVSKPALVSTGVIDFTLFRSESEAILQNQQTLVASGLVETVKNEFENKFPLLGDIPILNFFFNDRGERYEDRELVVFITPYLPTTFESQLLEEQGYRQGSVQWKEALRRADPVLDDQDR